MGTSPFFFRKNIMLNRGLDKLELLRIVEAVANEKSIDKELVIYSRRFKKQHFLNLVMTIILKLLLIEKVEK